MSSKPVINWFEIPVRDIQKSTRLYEAMLDTKLQQSDFGGVPHAVLSNGDMAATSGALVADPKRPPRGNGTTIYLNAKDGVGPCLRRAVEAGAKVVQPETSIAPYGTIGLIEDFDGNVIGLHANPER